MIEITRREFNAYLGAFLAGAILPGCLPIRRDSGSLTVRDIRTLTGYPELDISTLDDRLSIDIGTKNSVGEFRDVIYDYFPKKEVKTLYGVIYLDPDRKLEEGIFQSDLK
ncbi:MAG TPA: hypothetical protein VJJ79_03015 [Candidatus Nanoarchaeia archaeon]|nr:hypothetical protein [Candidatus Woesearchaeota archaeon]HLC22719.1 hypothetical protein [Candidatus Nanoarchaeia archaeon]